MLQSRHGFKPAGGSSIRQQARRRQHKTSRLSAAAGSFIGMQLWFVFGSSAPGPREESAAKRSSKPDGDKQSSKPDGDRLCIDSLSAPKSERNRFMKYYNNPCIGKGYFVM